MRLIATIGASGISRKHKYIIESKSYDSELSFMALSKAYNIDDIVVIGTKKSEESIQSILDLNPNIEMVVIESDNVEDVFQKSLEYIAKDTILDLTQGYRHYPMLTLLASVFLQSNEFKNIKDIFYAQVEDENCQAYKESCSYRVTSLIKYLDIANMTRIINTFNKTLFTLEYSVNSDEFIKIRDGLTELTKDMLSNNFNRSKVKAQKIEELVKKIIEDKSLSIIEEHLSHLKKELQIIQNLVRRKESQTLLNVSEYFLKKDILLHSVTLLYESMVAFLDEKIKNNPKCKDKKDTYQRRNCLKKSLGECKYVRNINKCREFSDYLFRIDKLRNTSAHAHTTGTYQESLKDELLETIKFIKPIMAG
jgi:hypothetical protein